MWTHADDVDLADGVHVCKPYCFTKHGYVAATQNGHLSSNLRTGQSYGFQGLLVLASHRAWRNSVLLRHLGTNSHFFFNLLCIKPTILASAN